MVHTPRDTPTPTGADGLILNLLNIKLKSNLLISKVSTGFWGRFSTFERGLSVAQKS